MYILGTIGKDEIKAFRKECGELGWQIIEETNSTIKYLDKQCNVRELGIGSKSAYVIMG